MKNIYPTIAIIVGVLLSFLYFIYIKKYAKDKQWDTATNFITTILSIVIGTMISIILYNYQKDTENQQKLLEMRTNLEAELSDIKRVLSTGEPINVNGLPFLTTYIQPIIIDECSKSGLFIPRDIENLLHLSRKIKFYNTQVNYFLSILTSNSAQFHNLLQNCNKNMETSRLAIIQDINQLKFQLELTLSDSLNF